MRHSLFEAFCPSLVQSLLLLCAIVGAGVTLGIIPMAHGEALNHFPSALGSDCICADS